MILKKCPNPMHTGLSWSKRRDFSKKRKKFKKSITTFKRANRRGKRKHKVMILLWKFKQDVYFQEYHKLPSFKTRK